MAIEIVTLTGRFTDGSGGSPYGTLTFTPSVPLVDMTDSTTVPASPVTVTLDSGGSFSIPLYATDSADLAPSGWTWGVTQVIAGLPPSSWSFFLARADGATQDISALTPVATATPASACLPESGGTMTGPVILGGSPPLKLPSGVSGEVLTSDSSGNLTLQAATGAVTSVNTQTGAVVLTAANVGADASGAASAAQANAEAASLPRAGGTMSGPIAMGGSKITGLANGTGAQDAAAFGQIPLADTTGADIQALGASAVAGSNGKWADSGHVHPNAGVVTGVTAGDTSVVVGGTSAAPTIETATLDVIAADHPPAANWSNNSRKITSLTAGAATGEAVAFQQLPSSSSPLAISSGGTGTSAGAPQNDVFAGPASGTGAPSFRALVSADIPANAANTSGTAAGLSATLAIGSGGTGSPTRNFAGLLTPVSVVTFSASPYLAAAGAFVPVDTTSGNVTVNLPAAPADLTTIAVKHVIQGGTNTVTIARGGSTDVFNKAAGATSETLTLANQGTVLQYSAGPAIWYVCADDLALSQLDARYLTLSGGTMAGAIAMGSNKITGLTNGSGLQDAAAYGQTPAGGNTATVGQGGTGDTSLAAYAPLAGGTTTTGAVQSASTGQGTSGNVFTSTGSSSLPSFQPLPAASTSVAGIVELDGTAGDIQPVGASAAAGSSTKAAAANHVHVGLLPSNNLSDVSSAGTALTNLGAAAAAAYAYGYAGWTADYTGAGVTAPTSSSWAAGAEYFLQLLVVPGITVNGYVSFLWHTASGMANSYFSVYTVSAGVVTLVGSTADQSSTANGFQRVAVSGFTSTPSSGILYVGYMNGTSGVAGGPYYQTSGWGTSGPSAANLPTASKTRLVAHNGSYSSPPSPYTLSGAGVGSLPFWCALD